MSQPAKKLKTSAGVQAASATEEDDSRMLDVADFDSIVEEMKVYDERRETVIKRSRDIQKASKQAIFSLHRGDFSEAEQRLTSARKGAEELAPLIQEMPSLRGGSYSGAMEEYAEAICFLMYLKEARLPSKKEVELVENEEWLGGVLDFTGELNRFAVARATLRDKKAVMDARNLVNNISYHMLRLDLRNGALRKKYDGLKYTVKKLEQILYELSLTEAGLAVKPQQEDAPPTKAEDRQNDNE